MSFATLAAYRSRRDLSASTGPAAKWRSRFAVWRLDGLLDEPQPEPPRPISDAQVEEVIVGGSGSRRRKTLRTGRRERWRRRSGCRRARRRGPGGSTGSHRSPGRQQVDERPAGQPFCLGDRLLDRLDDSGHYDAVRINTQSASPALLGPGEVKVIVPVLENGPPFNALDVPAVGSYQRASTGPDKLARSTEMVVAVGR